MVDGVVDGAIGTARRSGGGSAVVRSLSIAVLVVAAGPRKTVVGIVAAGGSSERLQIGDDCGVSVYSHSLLADRIRERKRL